MNKQIRVYKCGTITHCWSYKEAINVWQALDWLEKYMLKHNVWFDPDKIAEAVMKTDFS